MSKNGFEFSGFRSLPSEREFLPLEGMKAGTGLTVAINLDLLTLEKMEQFDGELERLFKESLGFLAAIEEAAGEEKSDAEVKEPETKEKSLTVPSRYSLFANEKAKLRYYATVLAGKPGCDDPFDRLVHHWNVINPKTKKPVPVSYETFLQMPPHGLQRLYVFCLGEANNPTAQEKKP